ncbi:unnamed protein product [Clavelina lepadiformis]|uniref:Uncharacterized protein n=1 Tax=Clavelina lepadiformis TaxID=159417 RepID=A0ABP0F1V4_CLALP
MKKLNYDITRRTDAARKSSRRAEIRLAQKFNDAGGIENEMRYHLSELRRQQANLRRELQGLKFDSKRSSKLPKNDTSDSEDDIISRDQYDEIYGDDRRPKTTINKDYGRNYFGYVSTPGANKTMLRVRTATDIERSLDKYYDKANHRMQEENRERKMQQQKKRNDDIQEKIENWKKKNSTKKKQYGFQSKTTAFKDLSRTKTREKINSVVALRNSPEKDPNKAHYWKPDNEEDSTTETYVNDKDLENSNSEKPNNKENKQRRSSRINFEEEDNLIFDTDLYAPDGRIRMVHMMPEFQQAFREARQTRYVRTKEKRDIETQLSASQIFEDRL